MRSAALPLTLLAFLTAGIPSTATAATRQQCPARHAHVLLRDAHSAVYWFPRRGLEGYEEAEAVYACTRGHHAVLLSEVLGFGDNAGPCTEHGGCLRADWRRTIALAGTMLAYESDSGEPSKYSICDCERWHITLVDLSTGQVLYRVPTGPHHGDIEPHGYPSEAEPNDHGDLYVGVGPAEQVVVNAHGSVAWIAWNYISWLEAFRAGRKHEPRFYELRVIDRDGEQLIASGTALDPHGLTLSDNRLEYDTRTSAALQ